MGLPNISGRISQIQGSNIPKPIRTKVLDLLVIDTTCKAIVGILIFDLKLQ